MLSDAPQLPEWPLPQPPLQHPGASLAPGPSLRSHPWDGASSTCLTPRGPPELLQAGTCSNYLPLDFELLGSKLKRANFSTHFLGKGHLGYQTTDHLPINRGWDSHVVRLHILKSAH